MYQEHFHQMSIKTTNPTEEEIQQLLEYEADDLQASIHQRYGVPIEEWAVPHFYGYMRRMKKQGVSARKSWNRYLESCDRQFGEPCGCSVEPAHYSIDFLYDNKIVANLCPYHWWVKMVTLNHDEGSASKFVEGTPIGKFMEVYKIK